MLIHNPFPQHRQWDPKRRAEWRVYREFEESDHDGHVIYELKTSRTAPEVDFFAIIQDRCVVCLQVKGGPNRVMRGDWHLETDQGPEYVSDPMALTWDAAMAVRDHLKQVLGRKIFMLSVLILPDMEPDEDIEALAENNKTAVLFGYTDLVEKLVELAEARDVYGTPSPGMAQMIVDALLPHRKADKNDEPRETRSPSQPEIPGMSDRPVDVRHADVVNAYHYLAPVTINNYYGEDDTASPKGVIPC